MRYNLTTTATATAAATTTTTLADTLEDYPTRRLVREEAGLVIPNPS